MLERLQKDDKLALHYYERPLSAKSLVVHYSIPHFQRYLFDPKNPFCQAVQAFLINDAEVRPDLIPAGWNLKTLQELQREGTITVAPISFLDIRRANQQFNSWPLFDHKARLMLDEDGEPVIVG